MLVSHWWKSRARNYWEGLPLEDFAKKFIYDAAQEAKIFYIEDLGVMVDAIKSIENNDLICRELFALPFATVLLETKRPDGKTCALISKTEIGQYKYSLISAEQEPSGKNMLSRVMVFFNEDSLCSDGTVNDISILDLQSGKYIEKLDDELSNYLGYISESIATIAFLNSPKIIDIITKPTQHFLNKKRIRNGKPPITEYHVIKLKPEIERQFKESEKNAASGKMPFHWRRGHFKALPCGLRWWNAHTVGKKENGEVISGYLLEGA